MESGSPRTAREVIDEAISENKPAERLLYVLATASAFVGLFVLLWAVLMREGIPALAGSLCTSLFWPAIRETKKIRKENIALRLLEAPLSKAQTEDAAAEMLNRLFEKVFSDDSQKDSPTAAAIAPARAKGAANV